MRSKGLVLILVMLWFHRAAAIGENGPANLCGRALNNYIVNLCAYGTNYGLFAKREIINEADYKDIIRGCCLGICREEDLTRLC